MAMSEIPFGVRHNGHKVGAFAVPSAQISGPFLFTVDDPFVSVEYGSALQPWRRRRRGEVGCSARFAEGHCRCWCWNVWIGKWCKKRLIWSGVPALMTGASPSMTPPKLSMISGITVQSSSHMIAASIPPEAVPPSSCGIMLVSTPNLTASSWAVRMMPAAVSGDSDTLILATNGSRCSSAKRRDAVLSRCCSGVNENWTDV